MYDNPFTTFDKIFLLHLYAIFICEGFRNVLPLEINLATQALPLSIIGTWVFSPIGSGFISFFLKISAK